MSVNGESFDRWLVCKYKQTHPNTQELIQIDLTSSKLYQMSSRKYDIHSIFFVPGLKLRSSPFLPKQFSSHNLSIYSYKMILKTTTLLHL